MRYGRNWRTRHTGLVPPIGCESPQNPQNYLQTDADNDKIAYFAVVLAANNNRIMKEEKYVWVYVDYREEEGGEIEFSTPGPPPDITLRSPRTP